MQVPPGTVPLDAAAEEALQTPRDLKALWARYGPRVRPDAPARQVTSPVTRAMPMSLPRQVALLLFVFSIGAAIVAKA